MLDGGRIVSACQRGYGLQVRGAALVRLEYPKFIICYHSRIIAAPLLLVARELKKSRATYEGIHRSAGRCRYVFRPDCVAYAGMQRLTRLERQGVPAHRRVQQPVSQ